MTNAETVALLGAALLAGILNAVAGGGSFISFPALLFFRCPPVAANATNAVATWPGLITGTWGYRNRLRPHWKAVALLSLISIAGGIGGGLLVVVTPPRLFSYLVPFLMLIGVVLLAYGPRWIKARQGLQPEQDEEPLLSGIFRLRSFLQFLVSLYGGYFVGGAGILQMAMFSAFGIRDIQLVNALKNAMGVMMTGAAVITFMFHGKVLWPQAIVMTIGSIAGGYVGAMLAQRLSQQTLRSVILLFGMGMTIYFFYKFYVHPA